MIDINDSRDNPLRENSRITQQFLANTKNTRREGNINFRKDNLILSLYHREEIYHSKVGIYQVL